MKINKSPWIHQLNHEREAVVLHGDISTDVAIVGAGIAGVATAFFLLEKTDKKITLFDGGRLAHGATGHNAGQITKYFERSLKSIMDEYGIEKAKHAQESIESAWELLDHIYTKAKLTIPVSRFTGFAGVADLERTVRFLEDNVVRKECGLEIDEFLIADNAPFLKEIPPKFKEFYVVVPQSMILEKLETKDTRFYGCLLEQKGCMNSALFCQEVISYLLKEYKNRFALYEHTHIHKVVLKKEFALLDALNHTVIASKVVLCTNGFENIHILNESGLDIDTKFHHLLEGVVGFMSGYLKSYKKPPIAISYITDSGSPLDGEYFYLTRRQYEFDEDRKENLISIGGPEVLLEDGGEYMSDQDFPEEAQKIIDNFARNTFEGNPDEKISYEFFWHGLMGYTQNKIRLIGSEPKNPILLYNLGCNGVGILPSLYGGQRITQIIRGDNLEESVFDPKG